MNSFGSKSLANLDTCEPDLQAVMKETIRISPVDFSIIFGHRPPEKQFELFKQGRELQNGIWVMIDQKKIVTNCDGYKVLSPHNYKPSRALDIEIYIEDRPDLAYDLEHLSHVAGIVITVAAYMFDRHLILHRIRWGGNWDGNGIILRDQKLLDRPHYEIITD